MEGYDTCLLSSLYGLDSFTKRFGHLNKANGVYEITAPWQTGLSMCAGVGEIIGLMACGLVATRVGYRWSLIPALLSSFCFIFLSSLDNRLECLPLVKCSVVSAGDSSKR